MRSYRAGSVVGIEEGRRRMLSALFSSLSMGCAISWYNFASTWLGSSLFAADAGPLPTSVATTLATGTMLFLLLVTLGIHRSRLEHPHFYTVVLTLGAGSAVALALLVGAVQLNALPLSFAKVPSALITAYLYALMLCSWAQCLGNRSIKGAMVSVSYGLLVAAATSLPLVSGLVPPSTFTAAFALLPFAFSALALIINQKRNRSSFGAKRQDEASSPQAQPSFSVKGRTLPIIPVYATLMGFATTQFYTLNASSSSTTASLAMFLSTGVVFLFVTLFMIRMLDIGWCLFMSGVIFCVAIALWLFLPQPGGLVVVITGSLHWSSFLLLIAASFSTANRQRQRCASNACLSLALFYMATGLGSLTTLLGVESRVIVGGAAGAVLLGALVFARRQEKLSLAATMAVHDETDRTDALTQLANDYELSPREKDVFTLLADGNSLKHIAEELFISENTVKRHRSNVYLKFMVNSRQELIDKAKVELKTP